MQSYEWTTDELHQLSQVGSSREFLKLCLELRKEKGQPHSYAFIARSAGFASRSFPREVVTGKKSLTLLSAQALGVGLKLNQDLREYLIALVDFETGAANTADAQKKEKKLKSIRTRIHRRKSGSGSENETVFLDRHFSSVFSALGRPDKGATLQEIEKRTGLGIAEIHLTVEHLVKLGLVEIKNNRYIGLGNHLAFTELKKNGAFHRLFLDRIQTVRSLAAKDFDSKRALFQETTFSVRQDRLPQLKAELRELILKFVDEAEDAEGDGIASLLVSLLSLTDRTP